MLSFDPLKRDSDNLLKNHTWLNSKNQEEDHDDPHNQYYKKELNLRRKKLKNSFQDSPEHLKKGVNHFLVNEEDFYSEYDLKELGIDGNVVFGF